MWKRPTRRRLPEALAGAVALARRERPLPCARCERGCSLVATTHGLWECPRQRPPLRHCWRAIEEVRVAPGRLAVRAAGQPDAACFHVIAAGDELPELVLALDAGSRRLELAFTLRSGNRLRIAARSCQFEGTLVWTSRLDACNGSDPRADAVATRALLARARAEYGTTEPPAGPLGA